MSVLVEGISVVVRKSTIELKYPGGVARYKDLHPGTFCHDEHLTRVGFMVPDDVAAYIQYLVRFGFEFVQDDHYLEMAVVDQLEGPATRCGWLAFSRHPEGYSSAWLVGTEPGSLAVPSGWELENSLSRKSSFVPNEEAGRKSRYVRTQANGVEVYLNLETGKEEYIGRAMPPGAPPPQPIRAFPDDVREALAVVWAARERYERLGDRLALDQAIVVGERLLNMPGFASMDLAFRLESLDNLGCDYYRRFQALGDRGDLDRAIACSRKALSESPADLPGRPIIEHNLLVALRARRALSDGSP